MRYALLRELIRLGLEMSIWEDRVVFTPGPEPAETAGREVILTNAGGPGLNTENLFDGIAWQIRACGDQNNYEDAEDLAWHIDGWLLRNSYSHDVGGLWVKNISRVGSAPSPLLVDDADRHHFVCSYVFDVQSSAI